jgi:hypothetical protein
VRYPPPPPSVSLTAFHRVWQSTVSSDGIGFGYVRKVNGRLEYLDRHLLLKLNSRGFRAEVHGSVSSCVLHNTVITCIYIMQMHEPAELNENAAS